MNEATPMITTLGGHFNLPKELDTKIDKEKDMENMSYYSTIESLTYVMVSTRTDMIHTIGVTTRPI